MKSTLDPAEAHIASHIERINRHLEGIIPDVNTPYQSLYESARYSLEGRAKRIRPLLAIMTAEALEVPVRQALSPACALELVHTYSLVHDDLPCMDDDDMRRGKPSLHKAFGDTQSVLTGDYLLTLAFQLLADCQGISPGKKVKLISALSLASGDAGLIGGQIMDLDDEGLKTIDFLKETHLRKTAYPIRCAMEFGTILGEADKNSEKAFLSFGEKIGLAFQVIDDVLDVTSSFKKRGKERGPDGEKNKATYVTELGLDKAKDFADELLASAVAELDPVPYPVENLKSIAIRLVNREW